MSRGVGGIEDELAAVDLSGAPGRSNSTNDQTHYGDGGGSYGNSSAPSTQQQQQQPSPSSLSSQQPQSSDSPTFGAGPSAYGPATGGMPSSPNGQRPPLSANSSYGQQQQQQQQQYQGYQPSPQQQQQSSYPSQPGRPSVSSITSMATTADSFRTGAGRPSLDDGRRPSSNSSFHSSAQAYHSAGGSNGGGGRPSLSSPTPALELDGTALGAGFGALGFGQPGPSSATTLVGGGGSNGAVPVQFDEGVLRQLCELDCAMPLLDGRIKQSLASCKQVSIFLKARAKVEEGYARSLGEMGRDLMDQYSRSEGKAGTFIKAYQDSLRLSDTVAQQRLRFATRLGEMADELGALAKEMEKARKMHKETGARYERLLQDADLAMEKAKSRFDTTVEELERILILKEGGSLKDATMQNGAGGSGSGSSSNDAKKKFGKLGGGLFKNKNPVQMQRQEDETRVRMSQTSDAFRQAVLEAQSVRQEYFNSQLPKILRLLKQCADEIDLATQYHLSRYAFLYESQLVQEGGAIAPIDPPEGVHGLKAIVDSVDNRTDFKTYMQNFIVARSGPSRGPRREGLYEEGYQPPLPPHVQNSQAQAGAGAVSAGAPGGGGSPSASVVFGFDLTDAMVRDGDEVPRILEMCAETIEARGLTSMGIYRLSGMTSAVQKLKAAFDRDIATVDLENDDAYADINVIASTLKLWFRELPDPLFTYSQFGAFMEAARLDNDRLRHIRLHEQINELPDANYAALKYFMAHLHKVREQEKINQMSASNLAIVFGPTLFRQPPEGGGPEGMSMQDLMSFQCRAVETILLKYEEIFV